MKGIVCMELSHNSAIYHLEITMSNISAKFWYVSSNWSHNTFMQLRHLKQHMEIQTESHDSSLTYQVAG